MALPILVGLHRRNVLVSSSSLWRSNLSTCIDTSSPMLVLSDAVAACRCGGGRVSRIAGGGGLSTETRVPVFYTIYRTDKTYAI